MPRCFLPGLLAFCLVAMPCAALGMPGDPADDVQKILSSERLAGAAWSLVDGAEIHIGAAGTRDAERGTAMRAGDRVHVGSITKTLVALGLLRLASEGRIDLDAPVSAVLADIAFRNRWEETDPVRIRHLLDHTAGLEDARLWQMFSARVSPDDPLAAAFTRDASVLQVRTLPGERFSYSNIGYGLAGMMIEQVTGVRYEKWLAEHLLAPLGMRDSSFAFVSQTGPARDALLAWGHQDDLTPVPAMPIALRPAGQFTTTARDMAILARFLMGDGRLDGAVFVRSDLLRAMGRPTGTQAARAGLDTGYALGLVRRDRGGVIGLCHAGNIVGYHAMLCLYPEQQKAFFVSINTDSETADYARIDAAMMQALGLEPSRQSDTASTVDVSPWLGRYVPAPSRFAIQRYADLLAGGVSLERDSVGLAVTPFMGSPQRLAPAGGHLLKGEGRVAPSHVLLRDADGIPLLSQGTRTFRMIGTLPLVWLWGTLALGTIGIAHFAIVAPVLARRRRSAVIGPGTAGVFGLLGAVSLLVFQPLGSLGDPTATNIVIALATLSLPLAMLWQAIAEGMKRRMYWRLNLAASVAVLLLCTVLMNYGLIPLMLWC
ncbi:serine hydrolase domain-containing protein [Tahibacter sp.]|uniref:serine hydrolase domain-containing protein n=1 Tax=Tahibacter sp. TaxID=2056211 RepID=UPI0028C3B860|nr:serine hydrolase domain-containing protein [Tahibacter sp.]